VPEIVPVDSLFVAGRDRDLVSAIAASRPETISCDIDRPPFLADCQENSCEMNRLLAIQFESHRFEVRDLFLRLFDGIDAQTSNVRVDSQTR